MGSLEQIWQPTLTGPSPVTIAAETRWYAVQTRARHEKKVATQIRNKGIETFLPLITQTHRWSDRNKKVRLPMFPCYSFLRLDASLHKQVAVLQTPGVVGFVGIRGAGLPIPDKEIEDVQTLLASDVPCTLYPFLKVGQRVRIRGGCLDGVEGVLVAKNGNRNLVVSIEMIQRSVGICIKGYDVEPVWERRAMRAHTAVKLS
jgi:transcription antitermination factor NusG